MRGLRGVAWHETTRYFRGIDRRLLFLIALVGVLLASVWPTLQERGTQPDAGIFVVEVDGPSPLLSAVESDHRFRILNRPGSFAAGGADLFIQGESVFYDDASQRSVAAAKQLEETVKRWLDHVLAHEADQPAAFPVRVNLVLETRASTNLVPPEDNPPAATTSPPSTPAPTTTSSHPATNTTSSTQESPSTTPFAGLVPEDADPGSLGILPSQVEPPFPMRGLLLTFAYLIPINFVTQLYAGSLLAERTRRRGVLLLSAPVSSGQILMGKTLPYAVIALAIGIGVTFLIGSNLIGLLAIIPVLAFALATSLLIALIARSLRELTFLLVTTSVLLSTFLFLPAIFLEVHPVSFLSPVTVVALTVSGDSIPWAKFLYATMPMAIAAVILARLAVPLYREEHLFAPRRVTSKLVDAVYAVTPSLPRLFVAGALLIPFAIGLELFVLIFAVTLEVESAFVAFLIGGAFVEESLKGILVYARQRRSPDRSPNPFATGAVVGSGFFLGEKAALVFALVGFDILPLGSEALATFGVATTLPLLIAPLLLHVVTATMTAYGASKGKAGAFPAWMVASMTHIAYNVLLLRFILGGALV